MSKKDQAQGEGDVETGGQTGRAGRAAARRPMQAPGRAEPRPQETENAARDQAHSAASSRPDDLDADE